MINASLTVRQLNYYVRSLLESDANLRRVTVKGEISNYKRNAMSGHAYFSLKDEAASVRCVMFCSAAERLTFEPEDGMTVTLSGRVSVYERDGQYQINVDSMTPDGVGAAYTAFLNLCAKLNAEGLFAEEHKRPLPVLPYEIGVITSSTGAALQDIVSVASRRCPSVCLTVRPAVVQGEECAQSVLDALRFFNTVHPVDVIVIARGGGSYEDLAGFNDETLARAVYASDTPVVSAVGHEIDFTVLDFVADLRAPTPSAAAEIVVPEKEELLLNVGRAAFRCRRALETRLETEQNRLAAFGYRLNFANVLRERENNLQILSAGIKTAFRHYVERKDECFVSVTRRIGALNPLSVLTRGFALPYKEGKIVRSVDDVAEKDKLKIRVKDGVITCVTDKTEKLR